MEVLNANLLTILILLPAGTAWGQKEPAEGPTGIFESGAEYDQFMSSAKELAGRNVRVNAVAPGFIETNMTEVLPDDVRQQMLAAIPMNRFGLPRDVARVVVFLASDASSYMTGQVLTISGGMVT